MRARIALWSGAVAAWHFIHLPREKAIAIRKRFGKFERGWTSLPVRVTLGKTKWKTSIFYDKRNETYILPVKADVRRKEDVGDGDTVNFNIEILV